VKRFDQIRIAVSTCWPQSSFAKGSLLLLILWLFGILLPINLVSQEHSKWMGTQKLTVVFPNADFSQYYLAGVAARFGLWEQLYPKYRPEFVGQPGRQIWYSQTAEADPKLLAKVPDLPPYHVLNISPPPLAIVCLPLAWFSFTAAFKVWMSCLFLAMFGATVCAAKIYRRLGGSSGVVEGAFYLIGMVLPLLPHLIGGGDNVHMMLVFCTGVAVLVWASGQAAVLATSLIVPGIFKGVTAAWCPLLLFKPVKWQTLAWMAAWAILLNGAVVYLGGIQPYNTWRQDILPDAQSMDVQGNWDHTMNLKGMASHWGWDNFPASAMKGLHLAGLAVLYFGYWKQRDAKPTDAFANLCATVVGLQLLFMWCNPISWQFYVSYLLPFAGWGVLEYQQCPTPAREKIHILAGILILLIPPLHFGLLQFVWHVPKGAFLTVRDLFFGLEILFFVFACRRLFFARSWEFSPPASPKTGV